MKGKMTTWDAEGEGMVSPLLSLAFQGAWFAFSTNLRVFLMVQNIVAYIDREGN
jgi:hypothetical protein